MVKIISISLPEYTIDKKPDYVSLGTKIDEVIASNFDGEILVRSISMTDHPQLTMDQMVKIILEKGTDKYDPNRKAVGHEEFSGYDYDIQAGKVKTEDGRIVGESEGADIIQKFYENALLDRGYRLRIDLLVIYDPAKMILAKKIGDRKPSVHPRLERFMFKFKDPNDKLAALLGIIKILK